jgi:hypothetical protein
LFLSILLTGCEPSASPAGVGATGPRFVKTGKLESNKLDEASGLQAGDNGVLYTHNDHGNTIFVIDEAGRNLGELTVRGASNRDWEDITRVMGEDGPMLVVGDVGDNLGVRNDVRLYFIDEPEVGNHTDDLVVRHKVDISYPDGPRDVESIAYDPASDSILMLSKRDHPPRLYSVPLDLALWEEAVEATFLTELPEFRPPTRKDLLLHPKNGMWISQATGMDISADGRTAAVITYRSLYLFTREADETWPEAFQRPPVEYVGPPGSDEEAVAFGPEPGTVYITTEGRPAPIYRFEP